MSPNHSIREIVLFLIITTFLVGCSTVPARTTSTTQPTGSELVSTATINSQVLNTASPDSNIPFSLADYRFPASIDPAERYLFYLHGKIIEDQGIPAVSPDYGEYEYEAILERFRDFGFAVISEPRAKNADVMKSARKIAGEVETLIKAGVPPGSITVVGVSKGAYIAILVSHLLENPEVNFVIIAICHPDVIEELKMDQIVLSGYVLSIYDSIDAYAGSCRVFVSLSDAKHLSKFEEVVLHVGLGHGLVYKPLDEWMLPAVQWARERAQ